jgi:hypothetical protein
MKNISFKDWLRIGSKLNAITVRSDENNQTKISFNDPIVDKYKKQLWDEGVFVDTKPQKNYKHHKRDDKNWGNLDLLGGPVGKAHATPKKEPSGQAWLLHQLKEQFEGGNIVDSLLGVKIYFLERDKIIKIKGKNAYIIEHKRTETAKEEQKFITVATLDDNGLPIKITYDLKDIANEITAVDDADLDQAIKDVNVAIRAHNKSVENLTDRGGLQTIPPRFGVLEGLINVRLESLNGMKNSFENKISNFKEHKTISDMRHFTDTEMSNIGGSDYGKTPEDRVGSLINMYLGKEQELLDRVSSGDFNHFPDEDIATIKMYAQSLIDKREEVKLTKEKETKRRQEDIEDTDIETELPDVALPEISRKDVARHSKLKHTGYGSESKQLGSWGDALKTIERDILELSKIKNDCNALTLFINQLREETQDYSNISHLTREYLSDPSNGFNASEMKGFIADAKAFFRRYKVNIWSEHGSVNMTMLGQLASGKGPANFFIALHLKQVTTAFEIILRSYAGSNF